MVGLPVVTATGSSRTPAPTSTRVRRSRSAPDVCFSYLPALAGLRRVVGGPLAGFRKAVGKRLDSMCLWLQQCRESALSVHVHWPRAGWKSATAAWLPPAEEQRSATATPTLALESAPRLSPSTPAGVGECLVLAHPPVLTGCLACATRASAGSSASGEHFFHFFQCL